MKNLLITLFIFLFLVWYSCAPDPERELNTGEWVLVDSLFRKQSDSIRKLSDSLCEQMRVQIFDLSVDSIIDERIREILALRTR
ncbi:MAG TPA: hypothetical protein PKC30_12055 [Saprospiraceae bacterium]|nr:hypothetical protein [Saprospiraceae bacterium]